MVKTSLTALLIAGLVFATSFFYQETVTAQSPLTVESTDVPGNPESIQDPFLVQLSRISLLEQSLNNTLFQSIAFKSLKDFSREISEEARGRDNPFAPIGI